MTRVKICGLSRLQDIITVNRYMPDYIGFVFAGGSKRQIDDETAKTLKRALNPFIKAVGVFVNEEIGHIVHLCETDTIDVVQLHGDESEKDILALQKLITKPVIKAVRVRDEKDILKAENLSCDYLLLDAYQEKEYGGSGKTFDWSVLRSMEGIRKPFYLAGGINLENVMCAVSRFHPYCVDVSSGVETDGVKDPQKIRELITKVRDANVNHYEN